MTSCRANISVTVIDGKLFAVGGFSGITLQTSYLFSLEICVKFSLCCLVGKVFLNSVEYLDPESMEWTTFVNRSSAEDTRSEASAFSRRESQITLPPVDEENAEEKIPSNQVDSSGCESDEHSS